MKIIVSILALFTTALVVAQSDARFRIIEDGKIGYINDKGDIVIKPIYANGGDFSDGLAAVRENGLYGFIDSNGNYVLKPKYYYASHFINGLATVFQNDNKKTINKSGEIIPDNTLPKSETNNEETIKYIPRSVFENASINLENEKWGIIDSLGNYLVPAKFNKIGYYDTNGYVNGLLLLQIDDKIAYINKRGDIIWQEKKADSNKIKPLNIDFMMRGYFYANSKTKNSNGWAESDNLPKKIASRKFPKKQLSLIIVPDEKAVFAEEFYGCKVYLANTSGKKAIINASDSRLDIILQAQDSEGHWKDIEYTPQSWCGNSYHYVYLQSGEYWDFIMPLYDGANKTKIRAAFTYYENKEEKVIYSNAIEGTINPAQFFNKPDYYPKGLMDPYNE